MNFVGREKERERLLKKLKSDRAELIAILGRRRVGKTFLVKEVYRDNLFFHFTGLYKGRLKEQLSRFAKQINESLGTGMAVAIPENWFEAFDLLRSLIEGKKSKKKKVIFLDEFPWMATNKSRFLTAFTDFWNGFAVDRKDLIIVICGSSASWMINKIYKSKGGLHNRVTEKISLAPFKLKEVELFLRKKNIQISKIDIVNLYMVMGGVPFYLEQMEKGESIVQALNRICFEEDGLLQKEYDELFSSLFDNSKKHEKIVEVLSTHPRGLNREDLLKKTKLKSGGGFSAILDELEQSGFISNHTIYGKKKKDKIFKLKDFYTLFYLKYIKKNKSQTTNAWENISLSASWRSWSGLAFENVCFAHIPEIKTALKISGILSDTGTWNAVGTSEMKGSQVDLLFDRSDGIINICEIKFSKTEFIITSDYAKKLREKLLSFQYFTKTKKAIFPTMITTYGLVENKHSNEFIQNEITMAAFFKK